MNAAFILFFYCFLRFAGDKLPLLLVEYEQLPAKLELLGFHV